ncbi:antirestriction (ArdA) proteins [Streptococcus pneumoniae]|nr:antirestriction (ArdA) proteins [Streptococcus pneumoniae]VNN46688.1 antirestriction (ArdA) proteins [Streptococcus pneumoniae]VOP90519.1 antirestriction (ArdA) proteins [Streptococcus pneumoniae]VRN76805.1 antirestriction (ArdA) proteins [Streptococcus pneumoniae]VSQ74447.1 antirestriction (ArdA) proteins [Streptococcus pneumoniae]
MDLMALVIYKGIARRVLLPCSSEEVAERFGYEGQEIEVIIDSIECLPTLNCEDLTLDLANSIAENVEDVDEDLVLSFIESESSDPSYLASVDFDDCFLYPDVDTDRELGEYLVEELGVELSKEKLLQYLDHEKLGRDVRLEEGGSFVDKGYFVSR